MWRLAASIALVVSAACGAPGEGHGAEWQFVGARPEVVVSPDVERDHPDWTLCSGDDECVVVPAECCCDGRTWAAVHLSFVRAYAASVCEGAAPCSPECDEPPGARCEAGRCQVRP